MREKGFNMKSLSLKAGLGETYVRDILKRGREPGVEKARVLAEVLGVRMNEILSEPDLVTHEGEPEHIPFDEDNDNGWTEGWQARLPGGSAEVDARAGAGDGSSGQVLTLRSGGIQSGHLVTGEWVVPRAHLGANPARVIFIPVIGTSMQPILNPSDVVAVDTAVSDIKDAEIYVIDEGDGPSVKRLRLNHDDNPRTVDIISENIAVPPKRRPAELVRVIGLVIGKWSRM
ncbi:LexA family transcriptional regulator [Pleomorphomonas oryzae]|uniref:LexA family transcriptional regulator n=1 Tax=Pleomorphomonas oryzae TaxID=261934 RepID=UPI00047C1596|nr:S24 family peptidase [Pleomorphomonas oryzae]